MYRQTMIQKWLNKLLEPQFDGKDIIKKQLRKSKVIKDFNTAFYSLKFEVDRKVKRFSYKYRAPIQMIAKQKDGTAIVFLIHIIDGYVDELEIYSTSSEMPSIIDLKNVEYVIESELNNK